LRALGIKEKALGENHPHTAESLYRLAGLYRDQQRVFEAEPLYERAISILDAHPELDELKTYWMRSGYAEFLRQTGRDTQAAELEERSGASDALQEMCRKEVRTREATIGPDSPELATSLGKLADLCLFQEEYDKAEQHYLRALSIREAALGPDDSSIPASLSGLATIYRFRQQYADAEALIQRAARIYQNSVGKHSIEYGRTQEHLAALAAEQQQPQRAEELYESAVNTYRQVAGSESREYAEGIYHLAHFYARSKQFEKARGVLIELMEITEKDIDVAELEKADYFELYAGVLQELGHTAEADELLKRVETISSKEGNE
jgi:tetratricopeptide (TPR) repeat protein